MFSKIEVNGPNTHEVYKYLRKNSPLYDSSSQLTSEVPWNFTKFVVNKKGNVVSYFDPRSDWEDVTATVQRFLNEKDEL